MIESSWIVVESIGRNNATWHSRTHRFLLPGRAVRQFKKSSKSLMDLRESNEELFNPPEVAVQTVEVLVARRKSSIADGQSERVRE